MAAFKWTYNRCAIAALKMANVRRDVENSFWIGVAPVNLKGYINDVRHLIGDITPAASKQLSPRQSNVLLRLKDTSVGRSDLTKFVIITLMADD